LIDTRSAFWAVALATSLSSPLAVASSKISPHAVIPITQKSYPKLYAEWGANGIKRINELMPLAAQKVAASPECDRVDLVEISKQRSSPETKIVFFVDCANGKRFYIDQADLQSFQAAQSQTTKGSKLGDQQAIAACEQAVRAQLTNPMTFNRKFGTTSVYRAPTTGNVVVQFTFEAKNNLGAELSHKARCVTTDRGLESADISKS
jgi:hypothetical protein